MAADTKAGTLARRRNPCDSTAARLCAPALSAAPDSAGADTPQQFPGLAGCRRVRTEAFVADDRPSPPADAFRLPAGSV
jgi:hypothetical protein